MKLAIVICAILLVNSTIAFDCSGYSGFVKECQNDPTAFHNTIDTSVFKDNQCQVVVSTAGKDCNNYCTGQGKVCVAAQDNVNSDCTLDARHDRKDTSDNGCNQTWTNQVCVCGEPKPDPCEGYTGFVEQCSNDASAFHSTVDTSVLSSETACQVQVSTGGGNCSTYCQGQGKTCVAAQDNTGSTCTLDANHDRQDTNDNGCNQNWGNQVCVCDEQQAQDPAECAVIYSECNYQGDKVEICADTPQTSLVVKSLTVPEGKTLHLYNAENFDGVTKSFTQNVDCIDGNGVFAFIQMPSTGIQHHQRSKHLRKNKHHSKHSKQ